jgi:DNA-binding MarR family transcriptional regulator
VTVGSSDENERATRWLTPAEREAWLATSALILRLPSALESQLQRDSELTFFEYMVLVALSESPERSMQMSALASMASSSLSRLSHAASQLEAKGYLTRARIPGAGRRTAATLTDAGYAKVVEAAPGHVQHVRDLLIDRLTPEDLAALARAGNAVMTALGEGDSCAGVNAPAAD